MPSHAGRQEAALHQLPSKYISCAFYLKATLKPQVCPYAQASIWTTGIKTAQQRIDNCRCVKSWACWVRTGKHPYVSPCTQNDSKQGAPALKEPCRVQAVHTSSPCSSTSPILSTPGEDPTW